MFDKIMPRCYELNRALALNCVVANLSRTATNEQAVEITKRVKNEASLRKGSISDDVLEIIAKDVIEGR